MKGTGNWHKKTLLKLAVVAVALAAWVIFGSGRLSHEARENFEWFSTLGFPDVKGRPFVRVTTPVKVGLLAENTRSVMFNAFLLATKKEAEAWWDEFQSASH